jgi:hypothetical protein
MNKYVVTFLINGKKGEITIGNYSPASAFQMAKLLFPKAFIIKAVKA